MLADDISCGLHRIERLIRQQALKARPRWRRLPPDTGAYRTRDQAKADMFDYIERFYYPKRRHSTFGYRSAMEFEMKEH